MYYEINVSYCGEHLFATAPRSILTEDKAKRLYKLFKETFPTHHRYEISVTYYEGGGESIDFEKEGHNG